VTIPERLGAALADRYRIERELGAGGMATVYLAADLRHDRKVAIKVLKPELAAVLGAERFVVEIKTTAALQHPHILPLFDSGTADGFLFYVMPFIQGETIREKLNRETQFGVDDAIRIAREVADALDYAHRHGVIHRDIKPENILLHDGRAMVMDFGIALAVSAAAGGRMTETGLSLGTPHYMSPEQATADKDLTPRSDIYSLASVLYEMLAGQPPHIGGAAQQVIMKIITEQAAPVTAMRKNTPPNVVAALAKALEKLPADRFESAKAFSDALSNAGFAPTGTAAFAAQGRARRTSRAVVALTSVSAMLLIAAIWGWTRSTPPKQVLRYELGIDSSTALIRGARYGRIALSPDGSLLAYVGGLNNAVLLRKRDQLEATAIPGTDQSGAVAFSPDGKRIAFIQQARHLMIASLDGSPPVLVTDSLFGLAGLAWAGNDSLYVDGTGSTPLVRVAAKARSRPESFMALDSTRSETDALYPQVLPGNAGLMYTSITRPAGTASYAIVLVDLKSKTRKVIVEQATRAMYAPSGHLMYVTSDGTVMAARFDLKKGALTGTPTMVATIGTAESLSPAADFTLSASGTCAYVSGGDVGVQRELVWVTRSGKETLFDSTWVASLAEPALSPDGTRLAVMVGTTDATSDIWIKPVGQGGRLKVSSDAGAVNRYPVWTRDGNHVLYTSRVGNQVTLVEKSLDDGKVVARTRSAATNQPIAIITATPDAEWVVFSRDERLYANRRGDTSASRLIPDEVSQRQPAFSPDGRWLAYTLPVAAGAGRVVYVSPFPNPSGAKWLVSPTAASDPTWSSSGKELFYRKADNADVVAVSVTTSPAFSVGEPHVLFPGTTYMTRFSVSRDDSRFLMVKSKAGTMVPKLMMIENWVEALANKEQR